MVPSGACQIDGLAGSASIAGCAQAASGTTYRCGIEYPGDPARLWSEDRVVTRKGFEARVRELVTGQATLEHITRAMLSARSVLRVEYEKLHKSVLAMVREDAVCRRLMTVPGVGPLVAMTYKSASTIPAASRSRRRQEHCSG